MVRRHTNKPIWQCKFIEWLNTKWSLATAPIAWSKGRTATRKVIQAAEQYYSKFPEEHSSFPSIVAIIKLVVLWLLFIKSVFSMPTCSIVCIYFDFTITPRNKCQHLVILRRYLCPNWLKVGLYGKVSFDYFILY